MMLLEIFQVCNGGNLLNLCTNPHRCGPVCVRMCVYSHVFASFWRGGAALGATHVSAHVLCVV